MNFNIKIDSAAHEEFNIPMLPYKQTFNVFACKTLLSWNIYSMNE